MELNEHIKNNMKDKHSNNLIVRTRRSSSLNRKHVTRCKQERSKNSTWSVYEKGKVGNWCWPIWRATICRRSWAAQMEMLMVFVSLGLDMWMNDIKGIMKVIDTNGMFSKYLALLLHLINRSKCGYQNLNTKQNSYVQIKGSR